MIVNPHLKLFAELPSLLNGFFGNVGNGSWIGVLVNVGWRCFFAVILVRRQNHDYDFLCNYSQ